ncbi:MAG: long-chain fatty acid--CoA ligase [Acetobacteraceae bacterium]|nr:long-chain fatty acid--CoA ligase [Acetobacteraceae bacterium]MSP30701.1 long-chain fatty acid--CoA ligase [Acetobacteraceae bacterium]
MNAPYSRTLGELLFEQATRYTNAPAVFCGDRVASYTALANRAARIAASLAARGITRGDRVGLLLNNRLEWVETFFGAAMLGAEIVAFSTWSSQDELDYLIGDSGIVALVTLDRFSGQDFAAILRALIPEADQAGIWTSARFPTLHDIILLGEGGGAGWSTYADLLAATPLASLPAPGDGASAMDEAIIIYTSGSSSKPKSVPLPHYGIIENGFNIGERQGYSPQDRVLLAPPLFWSYGSANAMSATLTHGAALVLQSKFEPGEALDLIERHRCTALYTLPAMTAAMTGHPNFRRERMQSLRTGLTIGAPQDVIAAAEVLGAAEICNVYGQTESFGNCCVTWHHWPLERRARCQGPPLPGVRIRIAHPETGAALPPDEAGLIEVRGYIMRGYIGGSADQTADAITVDGYFRTGDMGQMTADGDMQFIGRTTEMIKKGGINISPAEVEDVLMRHPDVAQAGVVGVPDRLQGELLAAYVLVKSGARPTRENLIAHCRAQASRYKVPDFIEFPESLPVTVTGKLLRRELKKIAAGLAKNG